MNHFIFKGGPNIQTNKQNQNKTEQNKDITVIPKIRHKHPNYEYFGEHNH